MQLKSWPQTEAEYWHAIQDVGTFIWATSTNITCGSGSRGMMTDLGDLRQILTKLHVDIKKKFHVLSPDESPSRGIDVPEGYPTPPKGMEWYWDWYYDMKGRIGTIKFAKSLCKICPRFRGTSHEFAINDKIACAYSLQPIDRINVDCPAIYLGLVKESEHLRNIVESEGVGKMMEWVDRKSAKQGQQVIDE